jgi:2'-5' RNA ligase
VSERSGASLRCFVAVDLSPEVRTALTRAQAGLRAAAPRAEVRWLEPAGLHLTLKFLGQVAEDKVPAVVAALAAVRRAPIALAAAGLGGFPSLKRARVIWAGLASGVPALTALAADVDRVLAPVGFAPEARPFRGHVTIGRVRSPRGLAAVVEAIQGARAPVFGSWTAAEMVLYQSRLRPTGAVYEVVSRLPLAAGD